MKNYKVIIAMAALFCMINASANVNRSRPSGADLSREKVQLVDLTVDGILNGSLGNDKYGVSYASKVNQIRYYRYSAKNVANIWMRLREEVDKVNANSSFDQARKIMELKSLIDQFYSVLLNYKSKYGPY